MSRPDGKVITRHEDIPSPVQYQSGYQRHNDDRQAHPRTGGSGHNHNHHEVHHPNGYDRHGLPNGYWHYDPANGYHYVPWDVRHQGYGHYRDYFTNTQYHYSWEHHYYWHNHSNWDYHYYPDVWDTHVVILPPTQGYTYPRYEGPRVTLNEVGDLLANKQSLDRLRYDLMGYPVKERDSDAYRFKMKDVIDSYHYLIYQVYEEVARNESGSGWSRSQYHDDPVYQQVVESLWEESLALLKMYEAEFPHDTAMRGDSVNVLHWNLRESNLIKYNSSGNSFYRNLVDKVGREVITDR